MSIIQAIILGLLQGVTELFPISSLGHSIILPALFGWDIQRDNPYFLDFLIATHLATALVLLAFYWRDWLKIFKGLFRSVTAKRLNRRDTYSKLGWLLIAATVPAGIIGLVFEQPLRELFKSAQVASFFLIVNGVVLLMAERLRRRNPDGLDIDRTADEQIVKLSIKQSIAIGIAQSAALIPGISRSGSSMASGLKFGLNNEQAARFSFLLATPIIGAAAVLKLPELFKPEAESVQLPILVGSLCAATAAYVSIRFLTRYFRRDTLKPFGLYCLIAGLIASAILAI